MNTASEMIDSLKGQIQSQFREQKVILSFDSFLNLVAANPSRLLRNASTYLRDTFDHFGKYQVTTPNGTAIRFKLFDHGAEQGLAIVGGEHVQEEIYQIICSFVRQGRSNKLILLHGPNGSAKSSTIDAIARAMQRYSEMPDGAVYSFNWIFPTERTANPTSRGESGPIGFGGHYDNESRPSVSYALLDEAKIACKLHSEFRDNPIFLIPMPQREQMLREWFAQEQKIEPSEVEIPGHLLQPGLSKKNQLIYENLLTAYDGDVSKVLRHVQVERFFYSRQYRVGLAAVEPQMSIDAVERQLTMDKNIANLPAFLNNIRFHEASGPLVEANRGMLEFSDMLKRPVEAYKYLLTTVEKGTLNLPSSTANLDIVFFATTNEKHLDAFKNIPDFSSFRSRFELVTVPYLLQPSKEAQIYQVDIKSLAKIKKIAPHSLYSLCLWAVMTRYKQPDPEHYDARQRGLIARLDPKAKVLLYEGSPLQPTFTVSEETLLKDLRRRIYEESRGISIYEGRFGASPREIRVILHRAAQNPNAATLTPMTIFSELRRLVRDKTVYEFLQFEPRGKYHDAEKFIDIIEEDFAQKFAHETLMAMTLVEEFQYEAHLQRYIDHVVSYLKKEKIYNPATGSYELPNEDLMNDYEKIIGVTGPAERHRQTLLSRIAAFKLENPTQEINIPVIFHDLLKKQKEHYHEEQRQIVNSNYQAMLALDTDEGVNLDAAAIKQARSTFEQLEKRYGYDQESARACLQFLISFEKSHPQGPKEKK